MKISRKDALKSLGLGLITVPSFKESNFKREFLEAWKSSENYTLELYNQMPADLLNWKYTPESFSWRMQFVHCIIFNSAQLAARLEIEDPYEIITMKGGFWSKLSKEKLAKEIKGFYKWVEKVVLQTSESKLAELTSYGTEDIQIWRLFYALENHIIHHRGQAVCYLRLNGITPIGYVGW